MLVKEGDLIWLTPLELAPVLNCTARKVRDHIRAGKLGSYQRDQIGQYRVSIHDLELRLGPEIAARYWTMHADKAKATLTLARAELARLGMSPGSNIASVQISSPKPSASLNAT